VAWWSSALTPSREGARLIQNTGNPFPTLGIAALPLFRDLAGRFCLIRKNGLIGSEKSDTLQKNGWRDSQNPIHKKRKKKRIGTELQQCLTSGISLKLSSYHEVKGTDSPL
jgi:hypothetical protein